MAINKPTLLSNLAFNNVTRVVVKWDAESKCFDIELFGTDKPVLGYRYDRIHISAYGPDDDNPPHLEVEAAAPEAKTVWEEEAQRPVMPPFRDEDGHDGSD